MTKHQLQNKRARHRAQKITEQGTTSDGSEWQNVWLRFDGSLVAGYHLNPTQPTGVRKRSLFAPNSWPNNLSNNKSSALPESDAARDCVHSASSQVTHARQPRTTKMQ